MSMMIKDLAKLLKISVDDAQKLLEEKDEIAINLKDDIKTNINEA